MRTLLFLTAAVLLCACGMPPTMPAGASPPPGSVIVRDDTVVVAVPSLPPCPSREDLAIWSKEGEVRVGLPDICGSSTAAILRARPHFGSRLGIKLTSPVRRQRLAAWFIAGPAGCPEGEVGLSIGTSAGQSVAYGDVLPRRSAAAVDADIPSDARAELLVVLNAPRDCEMTLLALQFTEAPSP